MRLVTVKEGEHAVVCRCNAQLEPIAVFVDGHQTCGEDGAASMKGYGLPFNEQPVQHLLDAPRRRNAEVIQCDVNQRSQ